MSYITMHGLSFDGKNQIVETEVHENNIAAFLAAGWKQGSLPEAFKPAPKPVEDVKESSMEEGLDKIAGEQSKAPAPKPVEKAKPKKK